MAKSVLDILINVVKAGNGDKEAVKALVDLQRGYKQVVGVMGAVAGTAVAVNAAYQNTVKVFMDYASQVRETMRLTGMSAEETSKLIQAADDLTISYESLNKALWAASKQGIDVSIDSLAALADEYVAIEDPAQRAEFLAKNFGKSGQEMGKLMEKGASGVHSMTDAINGNLVLTDEAVKSAREYEIALDSMNDAVEGVKVGIGQGLVGAFSEAIENINNAEEITAEYNRLIEEGLSPLQAHLQAIENITRAHNTNNGEIDSATMSYRAWAEALGLINPQLEEQLDLTQQITTQNQGMLGLIQNIQSEMDSYNEKNNELILKYQQLTEEQSNYTAGSEEYQNLQVQIDETGSAINDLANQHEEAGKRIVFSLLQQKAAADGLTAAEFNGLLQVGGQMGIFDQQTIDTAMNWSEQADKMVASWNGPIGSAQTLNEQMQRMMNRSGSSWDFYVNIHTRGSFPGLPSRGNASGSGAGYENNSGKDSEFAEGGQWMAGKGLAVVGEEGFEFITSKGYVIPHDISQALMDAGIMPGRGFRIGGDLAGTGVFDGGAGYGASYGARLRKRRRSVSPSVVGSEINQAGSAVAAEVAPMAEATADAVTTVAAAQQQASAEAVATRDVISSGNIQTTSLLGDIKSLLQSQQANLQRSLVAGIQQAFP